MHIEQVEVRELTEYTPEVAAALGKLTLFLSATATGEPIPEQRLRKIIESEEYTQLIAEVDGHIVGAATLTNVVGIMGEKAYLEDFVTNNETRGLGVGHQLWLRMEEWCLSRGLEKMDFTSSYSREEAHAFYLKHGAEIRTETAPFRAAFTKVN